MMKVVMALKGMKRGFKKWLILCHEMKKNDAPAIERSGQKRPAASRNKQEKELKRPRKNEKNDRGISRNEDQASRS
jgi:hypothetical protein